MLCKGTDSAHGCSICEWEWKDYFAIYMFCMDTGIIESVVQMHRPINTCKWFVNYSRKLLPLTSYLMCFAFILQWWLDVGKKGVLANQQRVHLHFWKYILLTTSTYCKFHSDIWKSNANGSCYLGVHAHSYWQCNRENFYLSLSSLSPPDLLALFLSPTVGSHWEVRLSADVYLFLNHVEHNCATFMSQPSPTLVNKTRIQEHAWLTVWRIAESFSGSATLLMMNYRLATFQLPALSRFSQCWQKK